MKKLAPVAGLALVLLWFVHGCSGTAKLERIANPYSRTASQDGPIVVFLPGTLASTLVDTETGEMVWGRDDALSLDPREPSGLRRLSLPLDPVPSDRSAARDAIRPVDALRRARESVLGIPLSLAIYEEALNGFRDAGLPETPPLAIPRNGRALTVFPYDWRRSIVDAAQELGAALESRGPGASKVRLVGHSMGGAVALWYLMFGTAPLDSEGRPPPVTWAGARHVDRAVLFAPPLRGSVVAIRNTVNGNKLAGPLVPTFPPSMLATHPSSFELMPREETNSVVGRDGAPIAASPMSPDTWRDLKWGLADPEQAEDIEILGRGAPNAAALADARQAALLARGSAYHRAVDRPVDPPPGLSLTVIAGTGVDTPLTVSVGRDGGEVSVYRYGDGDGTVTVSSALAGFEDAETHPRKAVLAVEADHIDVLSDPLAFEFALRHLLN